MDELIAACDQEDGDLLQRLEAKVGKSLTDETVGTFNKSMMEHVRAAPPRSPPELPKVEEDKAVLSYAKVIESGRLEPKSYLGNKFRKSVEASGELEQYRAMDRAAAAAFRVKWAEREYENILMKRTQTTMWRRVDKEKGKYRPLGRLVKEYGGWRCAEAIKGAVCAAQKCLLLGPPWHRVHPQSGLVEYLVMECEFEESFAKSWCEFKEEWSQSKKKVDRPKALREQGKDNKVHEKQGPPMVGNMPRALHDEGKGKNSEGADKGANNEDGEEGGQMHDTLKERMAKGFKEGNKVKVLFHNATSAFASVSDKIESCPSWGWAKGGTQHKKLLDAKADLQVSMSEWHQDFVVSKDGGALKRKFDTLRTTNEIENFVKLKPKVDKLNAVTKSLLRAQAEFQRA